jgi:hypothetical protein
MSDPEVKFCREALSYAPHCCHRPDRAPTQEPTIQRRTDHPATLLLPAPCAVLQAGVYAAQPVNTASEDQSAVRFIFAPSSVGLEGGNPDSEAMTHLEVVKQVY